MAFIQLGEMEYGRDFTDPEGKFLFAYFCAAEQTTTMLRVARSGREDGNLVSYTQRRRWTSYSSFPSSAAFVLVAARRISSASSNKGDFSASGLWILYTTRFHRLKREELRKSEGGDLCKWK